MADELKIDLIEVLYKHKLINETNYRNEKITREYSELVKQGLTAGAARVRLAETYFTSEKNIEKILYKKEAE